MLKSMYEELREEFYKNTSRQSSIYTGDCYSDDDSDSDYDDDDADCFCD